MLSCRASGEPRPYVHWYHNDKRLEPEDLQSMKPRIQLNSRFVLRIEEVGYWKGVERILKEYWKNIERILREYWKGIERLLKGFWMDIQRVFIERVLKYLQRSLEFSCKNITKVLIQFRKFQKFQNFGPLKFGLKLGLKKLLSPFKKFFFS